MATELAALKQVATHEAIHRDFFKTAINRDAPGQIIPNLSVNFSSIDFTKQASILAVAQAFEDTGVAAYNGAGALIKNPTYLVLAGKIVSVEARHAAHIRFMRGQTAWVSNTDDVASNAAYTGATPETNTVQSNEDLATKLASMYSAADVAAAFDEALTPAEVLNKSRVGGLVQ